MLIGFDACERGFSHVRDDKPCQDAATRLVGPIREVGGVMEKNPSILSRIWRAVGGGREVGIAVVADGHGGAKYFRSDAGSKEAVDTAKSELWKFHNLFLSKLGRRADLDVNNWDDGYFEKNLVRTEQEIIRRWREAVAWRIEENPWTDNERRLCEQLHIDLADPEKQVSIYGTTLLAALVTPDYWLAVQIGDGLCVLTGADGAPKVAIPPDEAQGFGFTHSLCDAAAAEKFRHSFGRDRILGVTVATDGVADSFLPEKYLEFNLKLRDAFTEASGNASKNALAELKEYLPRLSEQGSRDDCAIAGIFRKEEK